MLQKGQAVGKSHKNVAPSKPYKNVIKFWVDPTKM
jgi:hypothetical protein